eukprot:scaffold8968_cov57-Phaeocystis_antarctica.AAC.5
MTTVPAAQLVPARRVASVGAGDHVAQPHGGVVAAVLVLGDDDDADPRRVLRLERGEALGAHARRRAQREQRLRVCRRVRHEWHGPPWRDAPPPPRGRRRWPPAPRAPSRATGACPAVRGTCGAPGLGLKLGVGLGLGCPAVRGTCGAPHRSWARGARPRWRPHPARAGSRPKRR